MNAAIIAPSILSADFTCLGDQLLEVEAGGADWIHVDVMDGHFVPNLTMGPFIVETCRRVTTLPMDVHLMVEKPERLMEAFRHAGASHLIVHAEACPDLPFTLKEIKALGCKAGVSINPESPVSSLLTGISLTDQVLVMSVHPGYAGQQFLSATLSKIAEIRKMLDETGSQARLEVDGGITAENISAIQKAGADAFVAAHAIFQHPGGIREGICSLRRELIA
jgi:ribulose-phosphate 3-epimerase